MVVAEALLFPCFMVRTIILTKNLLGFENDPLLLLVNTGHVF